MKDRIMDKIKWYQWHLYIKEQWHEYVKEDKSKITSNITIRR